MEKVAAKFCSHEDAEEADMKYYRSLTPQQRLEILFELVASVQSNETEQGFTRVYRITKLHES